MLLREKYKNDDRYMEIILIEDYELNRAFECILDMFKHFEWYHRIGDSRTRIMMKSDITVEEFEKFVSIWKLQQ